MTNQPSDDDAVDLHLGAVLDEVIDAVQAARQAVWTAPDHDRRHALDGVRGFLAERAAALADAEARHGGRSPELASPSGHRPRNLGAEAGYDPDEVVRLLRADLEAVAADVRDRAGAIDGTDEADLLRAVADGLDERLVGLGPAPGGRT